MNDIELKAKLARGENLRMLYSLRNLYGDSIPTDKLEAMIDAVHDEQKRWVRESMFKSISEPVFPLEPSASPENPPMPIPGFRIFDGDIKMNKSDWAISAIPTDFDFLLREEEGRFFISDHNDYKAQEKVFLMKQGGSESAIFEIIDSQKEVSGTTLILKLLEKPLTLSEYLQKQQNEEADLKDLSDRE